MSRYYLGVDGGQSSTTALIADETGKVIGVGRSGPCNHVSGAEAREKFLRVIGECLAPAAAVIPSGVPEFAAACLGFSGGAEDKLGYARELIRSAQLKVTNDAEIALIGAHAGEPGIIVIAGTGSIAFGRDSQGRIARAGGWGYIFGDEGGAFDLVRQALRAALRFEEGWGDETALRDRLLASTNAATANELLHRFYTQPRHAIATLAPLISQCAERGDHIAREVLSHAAHQLANYVEGVHRHLFAPAAIIPVACIGGVFQSALLLDAFSQRIRERLATDPVKPRFSPAAGALLEALRLDGNSAPLSGIPETKT